MKVLHLFDVYLHHTMNWAYSMIRNMPNCQISIGAPWVVMNKFFDPEFEYIVPLWQKTPATQVNDEHEMEGFKKVVLRLEGRFLWYVKQVEHEIKRVKPDVLHAHFGPIACRYAKLAQKTGIPLWVSFYGYDYQKAVYLNPALLPAYKRLFKVAQGVTAMGPKGRQILIQHGCDPAKIHIVPLGLQPELFEFRRKYKAPKSLSLVQIATFSPKKGYKDTLSAFHKALPCCPGLQLTIAGEHYDKRVVNEVKIFIETHNLAEHIRWLPELSPTDVPQTLREHDVFIQPSYTTTDFDCEGGPVSILEAQAVGLPVIATRHMDIDQEVLDGQTGLLSPERDTEHLAQSIIRFFNMDDEEFQLFSQKARHLVETKFDVRQIAQYLRSLYDEA